MEVVACRISKINTVLIVAVPLRFPKNLYQMDFSSVKVANVEQLLMGIYY